MRGSRQLKKCMAVLLAVAVGVTGITALPQARMEADAMTDKTMDEYDEIVSTYSVDSSVPDYKSYVKNYNAVYPDARIEVEAPPLRPPKELPCIFSAVWNLSFFRPPYS